MKYKNENRTIKYIKKLLKEHKELPKKIETPELKVRDFIIVDYRFMHKNKEVIVEYNGTQHYTPVAFDGDTNKAKKQLEEQKIRDQWLRQYCKKHNIILLEIDGRFINGQNIKQYLDLKLRELKLL